MTQSTFHTLPPISTHLESDIRGWIQRHGIVVWLDLDDHYSQFVDELIQLRTRDALPYEVRTFRGSYLELLLGLEEFTGGTEKRRLLLHLPGFNEEQVKSSPLLELYLAGARYRKALETLINEAAAGRAHTDQLDGFKALGALSLEAADRWLSDLLSEQEGGHSAQLRSMQPSAVLDDLLQRGPLAQRLAHPPERAALQSQLAAWTGLPASWREALQLGDAGGAEDLAFATSSWVLCVEYVHDLRRPPVSSHLQPAASLNSKIVDICRSLATHLRDRHETFYTRTADETELLLADEVAAALAEDLGQVDTFRFEEDRILLAALDALEAASWEQARTWAERRLSGQSFWVQQEVRRRAAWELVLGCARLGCEIAEAGNDPRTGGWGLSGVLAAYTRVGYRVDQAHRHLEQGRDGRLYQRPPHYERLRDLVRQLRQRWADWADDWARAFNALCVQEGFLPDAALQQRHLFDDVVKPAAETHGATAYFVVDAFRYELADELYQQLRKSSGSTVQLSARLAELPTVTEVGMNVLAPVVRSGKLYPVIRGEALKGFKAGEFQVITPETRKRAMHDRVGGTICPWLSLEEVLNRDSSSLKNTVSRASLVVVHSQEIDAVGEKGGGPAVFSTVLQKLRTAWRLLREAGVKRFVFTADHGFLLLDPQDPRKQPHGRKIDPGRRHVLTSQAEDNVGEVRVSLSALGYEGTDLHAFFPETTAVFDTGNRDKPFVHGGNSLQERVIPVLTVTHRTAVGGRVAGYRVEVEALGERFGQQCLKGIVQSRAQLGLDFGGPREVTLAIRAVEAPSVRAESLLTEGGARRVDDLLVAQVGESFELLFRLTGESDVRVQVELYHPGAEADVTPGRTAARFDVSVAAGGGARWEVEPASIESPDSGSKKPAVEVSVPDSTPQVAPPARDAWLEQLPEGGVRQVFAHLDAYGTITEAEATKILGSPRQLRSFTRKFEEYAAFASFVARIEVLAGIKRFKKEGSSS